MARKKIAPEQVLVRQGPVSAQNFIVAMRELQRNPSFILLKRVWLDARTELLEQGKQKPSEAAWNKLAGFDAAIMVPEIWAAKQTKEDDAKKRAEELARSLTGG